jgi:mycothiol synthase
MIWPEHLLDSPPAVNLEPGYFLRQFTPEDEPGWLALVAKADAGFEELTRDDLVALLSQALPGGFFLVVYRPTQQIVAAACAVDREEELHPQGGELGMLVADPAHSHHGLGQAVASAVVAHLLRAGYRHIYLITRDWRLPAIVTYLRLGFVPFMHTEGMQERWAKIYDILSQNPATRPEMLLRARSL